MKQSETGTQDDLIEHRFRIAKEDLDTAYLLLNESSTGVLIIGLIIPFTIQLIMIRFILLQGKLHYNK